MRYDDVLTLLGDFGRYQRVIFVLLCLPIMLVGVQQMSPVFTLATPKHRCAIPGLLNDTYQIQDAQHQALVDLYIPRDEEGEYATCRIYTRGHEVPGSHVANITAYISLGSSNSTANVSPGSNSTDTKACHDWVFDKSVFDNTVITDTQLVCSRTIYRAHATTAFNVGTLLSFFAGGPLMDRFGRKLVSLVDLVTMVVSSALLVWLPGIHVFIIIRLLIGLGFGVFFSTIFVYAMEFVGPSARTVCGILGDHFWAVGLLVQSLVAYCVRDWRALQLATSLPLVIFLTYWWKLPNSGRWLFAKGYTEEGKRVVAHMARVNKVELDVDSLTVDTGGNPTSGTGSWLILKLLKHRTLALRSGVVWFNWFVVSLLYYGLSWNVGNLHGDIYLNFTLSAVMELAAYTACIPGMYRLGRKRFYCACMLTGGTVLLLVIFPEMFGNKSTEWVIVMFVMVGKLSASAAYAVVYLLSAELFPTVVRGTAMAMCACCATLGSLIAPYIVELVNLLPGQFAQIVPLLIFGATSFAAGLLSLSLPETSHTQLPDTISDMKHQNTKKTTIAL